MWRSRDDCGAPFIEIETGGDDYVSGTRYDDDDDPHRVFEKLIAREREAERVLSESPADPDFYLHVQLQIENTGPLRIWVVLGEDVYETCFTGRPNRWVKGAFWTSGDALTILEDDKRRWFLNWHLIPVELSLIGREIVRGPAPVEISGPDHLLQHLQPHEGAPDLQAVVWQPDLWMTGQCRRTPSD